MKPAAGRSDDEVVSGGEPAVLRNVRDFDGYVVWADAACHTLLGWSFEELSSVPYWELLHHEDQHRTVERVQLELLSGPGALCGLEARMLGRDGRYRWVRWDSRSLPHELVYSVGVELSNRAPTEPGSTVAAGSWDWDVAANTVAWSDGMFEIHGLQSGRTWSLEAAVELQHPDDQAPIMQALHWSLASGEPYVADHRVVRPGGDIRWLHSAGRVLVNGNGDPTRLRGITQDITDRA
jgi:PAS domain S-box-containing protein